MDEVRFVALGDSITVGLGDPMPDGRWRGWAALLADSLAPPGALSYHNLAELGAKTVDVADRQLPAALALRPTVAAVVVGVNDTLRAAFDISAISRAYTRTVADLRAYGAVVLTARLPEPGRMFGLPASLARPLARRIEAVNAVADYASYRYGSIHFDAARHPEVYDPRMWSVDRLHPSERGHRLLAANYATMLAADGVPVYGLPGREPTNPPPTKRAEVAWMLTRGTKWVYDRCTDLIPHLLALAAKEWWHDLRGLTDRLDERLSREAASALAQVDAFAHHAASVSTPGVPLPR